MKLSTRMRYGTRALVQLGSSYPGALISLRSLAVAQELSAKYLEKIMLRLKLAGLVEVSRGGMGGYRLSIPPNKITLDKLYYVLETPNALVPCISDPTKCRRSPQCPSRPLWVRMEDNIQGMLRKTRISDLCDTEKKKKNVSKAKDGDNGRKRKRTPGYCP